MLECIKQILKCFFIEINDFGFTKWLKITKLCITNQYLKPIVWSHVKTIETSGSNQFHSKIWSLLENGPRVIENAHTLQKPVIVSQTYCDRCSISNHNKYNLPPHKLMMLGQLMNLL